MPLSLGGVSFTVSGSVDAKTISDLNKLSSAFDRLKKSSAGVKIPTVGASVGTGGTATGGRSKSSPSVDRFTEDAKKATSAASLLQQQVHMLSFAAAALGAHFAAVKLGSLIKDSTLLAGRVENLGTVLLQVGTNAGYSGAELSAYEERVKSLNITTRHAREALTLLARNNLDLAKGTQLARVAQDAAVIAGENSSESFEKLAISIQRLDTRLLRNRGIMINLRNLYQKVAMESGRVETSLTAQEKQQILLNEVLRVGVQTFGTYEAAMNDVYKRYTSLERQFEEARRVFGEQYLILFSGLVEAAGAFADAYINSTSNTKAFTSAIVSAGYAASKAAQYISTMGIAVAALNLAMSSTAVQSSAFLSFLFSLKGLGVIALGVGVLAGTVGYLAAQAQNAKMALKKLKDEAAEEALSMLQISEGAKRVKALGVAYREGKVSLDTLNDAITDLIANSGKHNASLVKMRDEATDWEDFLRRLAEGVKGSTDSYEQQLLNLDKVLLDVSVKKKKIEETIQEARKNAMEFRMVGPGAPTAPPIATDVDRMEKERNKMDAARAAYKAVQSSNAAQELRDLQKTIERQEVALNLAMRSEARINRERLKSFKDASLGILHDYVELEKKLAGDSATPEQLRRAAAATLVMKLEQFEEVSKKELELAKDDEERQKLEAKQKTTRLAIERQVGEELAGQLASRRKILEIQNQALLNVDKQLEAETRSINQMAELRKRTAAEEDPAIVQIEQRMEERKRQFREDLIANRKLLLGEAAVGSQEKEEEFNRRQLAADKELADLKTQIAQTQSELEDKLTELGRAGQDVKDSEEVHRLEQKLRYLGASKDVLDKDIEDLKKERKESTQGLLAERKAAEEQIALLKSGAKTEAAKEIAQYEQDIARIDKEIAQNQKARENLIRQAEEDLRKSLRELAEKRHASWVETEEFIRSVKNELSEKLLPGVTQLTQVFDDFVAHIRKARTETQLLQLQQLFPEKLRYLRVEMLDEVGKVQKEVLDKQRSIAEKYASARQEAFSAMMSGVPARMAKANAWSKFLSDSSEDRRELQKSRQAEIQARQKIANWDRISVDSKKRLSQEAEKQRKFIQEADRYAEKQVQDLNLILSLRKDEVAVMREKADLAKASLESEERQTELLLRRKMAEAKTSAEGVKAYREFEEWKKWQKEHGVNRAKAATPQVPAATTAKAGQAQEKPGATIPAAMPAAGGMSPFDLLRMLRILAGAGAVGAIGIAGSLQAGGRKKSPVEHLDQVAEETEKSLLEDARKRWQASEDAVQKSVADIMANTRKFTEAKYWESGQGQLRKVWQEQRASELSAERSLRERQEARSSGTPSPTTMGAYRDWLQRDRRGLGIAGRRGDKLAEKVLQGQISEERLMRAAKEQQDREAALSNLEQRRSVALANMNKRGRGAAGDDGARAAQLQASLASNAVRVAAARQRHEQILAANARRVSAKASAVTALGGHDLTATLGPAGGAKLSGSDLMLDPDRLERFKRNESVDDVMARIRKGTEAEYAASGPGQLRAQEKERHASELEDLRRIRERQDARSEGRPSSDTLEAYRDWLKRDRRGLGIAGRRGDKLAEKTLQGQISEERVSKQAQQEMLRKAAVDDVGKRARTIMAQMQARGVRGVGGGPAAPGVAAAAEKGLTPDQLAKHRLRDAERTAPPWAKAAARQLAKKQEEWRQQKFEDQGPLVTPEYTPQTSGDMSAWLRHTYKGEGFAGWQERAQRAQGQVGGYYQQRIDEAGTLKERSALQRQQRAAQYQLQQGAMREGRGRMMADRAERFKRFGRGGMDQPENVFAQVPEQIQQDVLQGPIAGGQQAAEAMKAMQGDLQKGADLLKKAFDAIKDAGKEVGKKFAEDMGKLADDSEGYSREIKGLVA